MQHLHRDFMVPVVILCPLMVSCYPDIPKQASSNPVLQVQHAWVDPRAYMAWTREDHPVEIRVLLKQHVLKCISGLGVGALTCHSCRANFTITNPNNFLSSKVSALHSVLATLMVFYLIAEIFLLRILVALLNREEPPFAANCSCPVELAP